MPAGLRGFGAPLYHLPASVFREVVIGIHPVVRIHDEWCDLMRWRALDFVNVSNLVNLTKQLKVADNAEPQVEKESCEERQKKFRETTFDESQLWFLN